MVVVVVAVMLMVVAVAVVAAERGDLVHHSSGHGFLPARGDEWDIEIAA